MLTKEQISFPMNFNDLPRASGFAIDYGEQAGKPFTALWSESGRARVPDHFWNGHKSQDFLHGFLLGYNAGVNEMGRDNVQ
jgi:hypothetical protein